MANSYFLVFDLCYTNKVLMPLVLYDIVMAINHTKWVGIISTGANGFS